MMDIKVPRILAWPLVLFQSSFVVLDSKIESIYNAVGKNDKLIGPQA